MISFLRCSRRHRPASISAVVLPSLLCLLVVLLGFSALPLCVQSWSGSDAYTVVLLSSFDSDIALQENFYNAPNGTPFIVSRDGYRILDTSVVRDGKPRKVRWDAVEEEEEAAPPSAAYRLDPLLTTSVAYRGAAASDAPLPFRGRLSGEWVVRIKEGPPHITAGDTTKTAAEPVLLHCRLPLPHNRTETQQQQRRYITQHAPALSNVLEAWWHTVPAAHTSCCLYGDGEKALTGVERYYEVCPGGVVSRVQHHRLTTLLRGSANASADETHHLLKEGAEKPPTVLGFLHEMHDSPASRNAVLRNPRYSGVFEEIGRYHPRYSKPRWNAEYLVWESWYPSVQPCRTHYTTASSATQQQRPLSSRPLNASQRRHLVHPEDAYWKTVVRFRCPPEPTAEGAQEVSTWTVTEVRQLCEYHVELMTQLVCEWEQELDSFNVNPVPCVVLD